MFKCPYCGKQYDERTWGMHTIKCDKNPKNMKAEKVVIEKPTEIVEKKTRKRKKK